MTMSEYKNADILLERKAYSQKKNIAQQRSIFLQYYPD